MRSGNMENDSDNVNMVCGEGEETVAAEALLLVAHEADVDGDGLATRADPDRTLVHVTVYFDVIIFDDTGCGDSEGAWVTSVPRPVLLRDALAGWGELAVPAHDERHGQSYEEFARASMEAPLPEGGESRMLILRVDFEPVAEAVAEVAPPPPVEALRQQLGHFAIASC